MTSWSQLGVVTSSEDPCAVVALAYSDTGLADKESAGVDRILSACTVSGFSAECGRWLDVISDQQRILVLGAGTSRSAEPGRWIAVGGFLFNAMQALRLPSIRLPSAASIGSENAFEQIVLGALLHSFRPEHRRARPKEDFEPSSLVVEARDAPLVESARRVANSVNRARAWVERPANLLNPPVFAAECRVLEQCGVRIRVLDANELEKLGAGGIIAVGRGAEHGPNLVVAEWRGNTTDDAWDAVLVGKGLTYDGGGLNLKTPPVIEKMKFDMAGAAAVLGAVELSAARKAKCNIVAVAPLVENAIDALAYRPGDVITSLSGLTIEVINTDAEGRIVLADALTFGLTNYQPRFIVDVATLTGAMASILHEEFAGCYATDDLLVAALTEAGELTGERIWRLPLHPSQDYLVDSPVADVANLGAGGFLGVGGRSPTAGAKFLQRFVGSARWAHIDIAGTAMSSRRTPLCGKGATGFGVRLLDAWLSSLESQRRVDRV